MSTAKEFDRQYQRHLQHLELKGLRPKTIEAYARAIRRIGQHFEFEIDALTEPQLTDYFTALLRTHSWSAVKLDLYGLKFYYQHVLARPWVAPGLVVPPKGRCLDHHRIGLRCLQRRARRGERAVKILLDGVAGEPSHRLAVKRVCALALDRRCICGKNDAQAQTGTH